MRFKRHGDPEKVTRKSPGTATDEDRKRWKREEYQRNKQKYIDRAARWAEKNKDKVRAYFDKEETKIKVRQRTREWSANNRERKKKADRDWANKNRALVRGYKAKRRAKERNATPPWLTEDHLAAIRAVYDEAERLTLETGIRYEVDHIVPLNGKIVSGLHVPWNLRAISAQDNNRRPRVWDHTQSA
jgi:hypothetical protein